MDIIKKRYSIEPRDRRYVKGYGFLTFPKNISSKYSQKLVNSAKKSATCNKNCLKNSNSEKSRSNWRFNWQ